MTHFHDPILSNLVDLKPNPKAPISFTSILMISGKANSSETCGEKKKGKELFWLMPRLSASSLNGRPVPTLLA